MELAGQQLANGITLGAVYALIALGYTMVFGVLNLIAFAQGGILMVGAYAALLIAPRLSGSGTGLELVGALIVAGLAGGLLNVAIDRIAYRPLRRSARLAPLISGIGAYIFLENGVGTWVGRQPRVYPSILPSGGSVVFDVYLTNAQLAILVISVLCMIALWFIVMRTRLGLSMRAVAERADTASLMGIEPERIILYTFFIGGVLAGIAGVLVGAYSGIATPTMGFLIGLKAFAGAVIGGIGHVPGALVGSMLVAIIEVFVAGYLSSGWADVFVFTMLIATLMVRPSGLLGTRVAQTL